LDALGPAPRAELLHVLMLPDFKRADRIGEFWGYPQSRAFAELVIDCEEDRTLSGGVGRHAAEMLTDPPRRWEPAAMSHSAGTDIVQTARQATAH
jgi:hypothetical protein